MSGTEELYETNKQVVIKYFQGVCSGDKDGILSLFSEDGLINEPFSKTSIVGKSQIEMFLKTVIMVNSGMQRDLKIERARGGKSRLIAFVTFVKSGILKGKFTFELDNTKKSKLEAKIKSLKIEFID